MMDKPMVAISTDFLTSFASLPKQKQGKATEFFNKFRTNPNSPGINYEKIDEGIDKNICISCRQIWKKMQKRRLGRS